VAVLLDALVVRCLLLPAVLELIGPLTWRLPRWLDSLLPHINIEGANARSLPSGEDVDGEDRRCWSRRLQALEHEETGRAGPALTQRQRNSRRSSANNDVGPTAEKLRRTRPREAGRVEGPVWRGGPPLTPAGRPRCPRR